MKNSKIATSANLKFCTMKSFKCRYIRRISVYFCERLRDFRLKVPLQFWVRVFAHFRNFHQMKLLPLN